MSSSSILLERLVSRWWPSTRLSRDPLADQLVDGRYQPVTVANFKLVPAMRRRVMALRTPKPLSFASGRRLTVVIPFRDRDAHLRELLPPLRARLREQGIGHRVLVVEQEGSGLFNRGKLINAGMHHAAGFSDYYCIHDVDAIPVEANYRCPSQPLRLVTTLISSDHAEGRPAHYFSGAVSILKEQAFVANGFSNEYWGWGKEDDDFFFRLLLQGYVCYADLRGSFHDLPNPGQQQPVVRARQKPTHLRQNRRRKSLLLRGLLSPSSDGLSTLAYQLLDTQSHDDYEKIRVRL